MKKTKASLASRNTATLGRKATVASKAYAKLPNPFKGKKPKKH